MLIDHTREKLINTIIFFAQRTQYCGKVKLFKLLYFLDFEHYKLTGRSVTGMDYYAWKMGPVPIQLAEELDCPEPDLAEAVEIAEIDINRSHPMLSLEPRREFDSQHFTKRELRLMNSLVSEYEFMLAGDMVEATHLENLPWDRVYNKENRKQAIIPYDYALRASELEEMQRHIRERSAALEALR